MIGSRGGPAPGTGKSYAALLVGVSVDAGLSSELWRIPAPAPVLYVNLERTKGAMLRRLGQVNDALGLEADRSLLMLHARGRSLVDVISQIGMAVREHAIQLVVVDSLSRSGMGDLTENLTANRAMDLLNGIPCAWLAIGHTPRADTSHIYGSVMFDAAADVSIQLVSDEAPGPRQQLALALKVTKANDIARSPSRVVVLEFS